MGRAGPTVAIVSLVLLASCAEAGWFGSGELCVEVAGEVGLELDNAYGPVTATEEVGQVMQRNMGNGGAVGDYDRDGDLDVYLLSNRGHPARLFQNQLADTDEARFVDVTEEAAVSDDGLGRVAHLADLDGDGWPDLVVVNDTDPEATTLTPSRIFRNQRDGTFIDVTEGSGFDPVGFLVGGAALADFDGDGDLDIYLSYWTRELGSSPIGAEIEGGWPGSNRYYENLGDFRFADVTEDVGLGGVRMDTFTALPHDFDDDGDLDIYLAVDHRADIYYEQKGGAFVETSADARVGHRGNDMGIAVADVDENGTFDLFVTNIYDPQQSYGVAPPGNTLLLSHTTADGGVRFGDEAEERGVFATGWSWGAAFVDMDLDTDPDLYVVQGFDEFIADQFELNDDTSRLLVNDGTGHFEPAPDLGCDLPGDQRALIPFDYDRDGDPDLLITQVDAPALLVENQATGNTITVALDPSDAASAGAVVEVVTEQGVTMRRLVVAGGSYLAGPPLEAYFGLGDETTADITVRWPTGNVRSYPSVESGTLLQVERENR